jgi:ADP-dependent phosphofructokinase/glucokinase
MLVVCAYNVNLDAVADISGDRLSHLIESQGLRSPLGLPEKISSLNDLVSALLFCMKEGCGAELLIDNQETASSIEQLFAWHFRLGGNAGNMANVLAELGANAVLNVPALGKNLASLINQRVRVPVLSEGKVILRSPLQAPTAAIEPVHFVLQFGSGEKVKAAGQTVISARENRLITTFDHLTQRLYNNPDFEAYCSEHISVADGALVSGFHLAPFPDYQKVVDQRIEQIRSWKRQNPDLYIHAEMGNFQNYEIMQYVLPRLPVDSIGMNEDELAGIRKFDPSWRGIMQEAKDLRHLLGISRICIHTKEFIVSAIGKNILPTEEANALEYGAGVAAGLAYSGKMVAKTPFLGASIAGTKAVNELCELPGAKRVGMGAYIISEDEALCLSPSFVVSQPRITVGLGDAMTAAAFFQQLKALKERGVS